MIKAIVFDYGGVIEINEKGLIKKITSYLNVPIEEWRKVYFSKNHLSNIHNMSYEEMFATVARELVALS